MTTDEQEIRRRVRALIMEMAPAEEPDHDPDPHLVDTLGYYSLALLELAYALEDEFDLPPIDMQAAHGIQRASDVERYVVEQLRLGAKADGEPRQ
jgi:acyl carrier protein